MGMAFGAIGLWGSFYFMNPEAQGFVGVFVLPLGSIGLLAGGSLLALKAFIERSYR